MNKAILIKIEWKVFNFFKIISPDSLHNKAKDVSNKSDEVIPK